jgi:hypothetical protein
MWREADWRAAQMAHRQRLMPFATERTTRMAQREKHPVHDFLFTYYSHRPALLLRWSPGPDIVLEHATPEDVGWKTEFERVSGGCILRRTTFPAHRQSFIRWAVQYLTNIANRPPQYGCFGLHEWAMVYREPAIRHATTPLRMTPDALAAFVESEQLCCTHYDAYRFFSAAAVPLNTHRLTRNVTDQFDQPGCVHVTMDLYRYAYKIAPWLDASIMADAFLLAARARQLDMQASPYDLRDYGIPAIAIETAAGKEEYMNRQRELFQASQPIRERLIAAYEYLQDGVGEPTPTR